MTTKGAKTATRSRNDLRDLVLIGSTSQSDHRLAPAGTFMKAHLRVDERTLCGKSAPDAMIVKAWAPQLPDCAVCARIYRAMI